MLNTELDEEEVSEERVSIRKDRTTIIKYHEGIKTKLRSVH